MKPNLSTKSLCRDRGGVDLKVAPAPALESGEALISIDLAGICRTDLYAAEGLLKVLEPRVLGHEFCGRVEKLASSESKLRRGDRVTAMPINPCRVCPTCRSGQPEFCPHSQFLGLDRDGAFTNLLKLPVQALVPVPDSLSDRQAAFAEPVAAALAIDKLPLSRNDRVLTDSKSRFSELVRRILEQRGGPELRSLDATDPGEEFDWAIETTANPDRLKELIGHLKPGGTLVLKSRPPTPVPIDFAPITQKELRLQGLHYGSIEDALRRMDSGALEVRDLLGDEVPLNEWPEAFARAREDESRKVFFRLESA